MCFSPKVKVPKVDTNQIRAPEPAPLTEEVKGVEFGSTTDEKDEGTSSEVKSTGKSSLKVELDKSKQTGGAKRMSIKSRMGGKK